MACPDDARDDAVRAHAYRRRPAEAVHDRLWAGDLRGAIRCSGALLGFLLLLDWLTDDLTPGRTALWTALAVLLFAVLFPPGVTAGPGRLASCGLLRRRCVRTDHLVSVRCLDGVGQRLVLRDAFGGRVRIDPRVLVVNPLLWHRVEEDARVAADRGLLLCDGTALRRLSERIDRETTRAVFKLSGLE